MILPLLISLAFLIAALFVRIVVVGSNENRPQKGAAVIAGMAVGTILCCVLVVLTDGNQAAASAIAFGVGVVAAETALSSTIRRTAARLYLSFASGVLVVTGTLLLINSLSK